jgi:predicted nucleic acid-binding protein
LIVVDASVLTDFLLGRPATVFALLAAIGDHEHEPLHAPDLIEPETLNALRKLALSGAIDGARASEAVADLQDTRLVRYSQAPLRARVWELRDNLTSYDATYLALAEALENPLLLTSDGGLAKQAAHSLGEQRVRLVA